MNKLPSRVLSNKSYRSPKAIAESNKKTAALKVPKFVPTRKSPRKRPAETDTNFEDLHEHDEIKKAKKDDDVESHCSRLFSEDEEVENEDKEKDNLENCPEKPIEKEEFEKPKVKNAFAVLKERKNNQKQKELAKNTKKNAKNNTSDKGKEKSKQSLIYEVIGNGKGGQKQLRSAPKESTK